MQFFEKIKEMVALPEVDESKSSESLENYLHKPLLDDDKVNVFFLKNDSNNMIEKQLDKSLKSLFGSSDFVYQGLQMTTDIDEADCVMFMLSENITEDDYLLLKNVPDHKTKIAFLTSSSNIKYDFTSLKNLIVVTQSINSTFPTNKIKKILKVNEDTQIVRLPLAPFFVHPRKGIDQTYKVAYQPYTAEIGLYEIMAYSLPNQYSGLEIECDSLDKAMFLQNHFIYNLDNIFIHNKSVIIKLPQDNTQNDVLKKHAIIKLLRIMRRSLETQLKD